MKRLIFIHQGVSGEVENAIIRFGFTVVRLPSFYAIGPFVRDHPDSLIFPLPDGRLLMHNDYYSANFALFNRLGLRYVLTDEPIGCKYPDDILFNALTLGGILYGRLDKISRVISNEYCDRVPVNQGYARCSVLALGENAAVTFDKGLADAMRKNSTEVLLLPPGGIALHGDGSRQTGVPDRFDGFIGGCGVMLDGETCGFFGDITAYAHYAELSEFAHSHNIRLLSLDSSPLADMGGAVIA